MKMKIIKIKGCKTCKEVLIFLDRGDDVNDCIKIIAWHDNDGDGDLLQSEEIFVNGKLGSLIISDFSEFAANEFANSFQL